MTRPHPDTNPSPQVAIDLLQRGRVKEAAELCAYSLKQAPRSGPWLHVQGVVLIKQGDSASAVEVLGRAIAESRSVAAYHHALGNALHSEGKIDRAITSYRRALRLDPKLAEAHNDLGTAYYDKHWLQEAEAAFQESLRLKSDHEAALTNLGATLRAQGRLREARKAFQRALIVRMKRTIARLLPFLVKHPIAGKQDIEPALAIAPERFNNNNNGNIHPGAAKPIADELKRTENLVLQPEGLSPARSLEEARLNALNQPGSDSAQYALGKLLAAKGDWPGALYEYTRATMLSPTVAKYHASLGIALHRLGSAQEAVGSYRESIRLTPTEASVHNNLAAALRDTGAFAEAVVASRDAIKLDPALGMAYESLAESLKALGRYEEASAAFERAVELAPGHLQTWLGFGGLLLDYMNDFDRAEYCFGRALEINPNWGATYHNLGLLAHLRGSFAAAHRHFEQAQRLSPASPLPAFSEGTLFLLEGEFEKGWSRYHLRAAMAGETPLFSVAKTPVWNGQSLTGKSILVHGEQGLGDEIMFASCLPEIIAQATRTVVACQPKLERLFRDSFPETTILPMVPNWESDWLSRPATTDFICPMGDLPIHLRRSRESFPAHCGYLRADPVRSAFWEEKLRNLGGGKKIGLSWMGGVGKTRRSRRSLEIDQLLPLLRIPDTHFVNLQYDASAAELAEMKEQSGIHLEHWPDAIDDYCETAALVSALDMTVSVCTSIVHLCGALSKPVWVMAPKVPEWRYGHEGPGMVWYPSARVYRQTASGEWTPVIERIAADLATLK